MYCASSVLNLGFAEFVGDVEASFVNGNHFGQEVGGDSLYTVVEVNSRAAYQVHLRCGCVGYNLGLLGGISLGRFCGYCFFTFGSVDGILLHVVCFELGVVRGDDAVVFTCCLQCENQVFLACVILFLAGQFVHSSYGCDYTRIINIVYFISYPSEQIVAIALSCASFYLAVNKFPCLDAAQVGVARVEAINEVEFVACHKQVFVFPCCANSLVFVEIQAILVNHAHAVVHHIGNECEAYERFGQLDGHSGSSAINLVLYVVKRKGLRIGVEYGCDSTFGQPWHIFSAIGAILHCVRKPCFAIVGVNDFSPAAIRVWHVVNKVGILASFTLLALVAFVTLVALLALCGNATVNAVDEPVAVVTDSDFSAVRTVIASRALRTFWTLRTSRASFTLVALVTLVAFFALGCLAGIHTVDIPVAVANFDRWNITVGTIFTILAVGTVLPGSTT